MKSCWAEETVPILMFVPCKRKVFKLLRLASRCQPISKASSILQAAGGCCRSILRAPGRRKPKNAALWIFKQCAPPGPSPMIYLSIQACWRVKAKSILYERQPNSF